MKSNTPSAPRVLVIIPCYNEELNIECVIERLCEACPGVDYLVVNDCSTDRSVSILQEKGYNYVNLPVNLGIGGGVQCGYMYATARGYDVTVQMDGDGQHRAEDLAAVLEPVAAGKLDMAIGSRFLTGEGFQTTPLRRAGIRILSMLIRVLTGAKIKDVTSGFRACNRRLTEYYARNYAQDYPEPEAIISAVTAGFRVGEVPAVMAERMGGESSIGPLAGAYYMLKVALALVVYRLILSKNHSGKEGPA